MSRLLRTLLAFAVFSVAVAAQAQHSCDGYPPGTETTIAFYTDLEGTECTGAFTNGFITGSIWVNLAGAAAGGITGVEFSDVGSYKANLNYTYLPAPDASLVIGDPFLGGTNIVFDTCQMGPRIRLATFLILEPERAYCDWDYFAVGPHENPTNYSFCCPLITLCDGPVFTKVCATGWSVHPDRSERDPAYSFWGNYREGIGFYTFVNGADPSCTGTGRCPPLTTGSPSGVSEATWSTVKSLYR